MREGEKVEEESRGGGREELEKDEVMALMCVLTLGVTLGLRRGRRTFQ